MFLPIHERLQEIERINLDKSNFKGEDALLYTYRNQVVAHLDVICKATDALPEDYTDIVKWFSLFRSATYWQSARKEKDPKIMANYIIENALADLEESNIDESFNKAAGIPSESEQEDVLHFIDSFKLVGSDKQIAWAKNIMLKNLKEIALHLRKNQSLPNSAKWWIDNRGAILQGMGNKNYANKG